MKPLFQAALELQTLIEKKNWRFCFIGGVALQRWGEPRLTVDVDVALLTGFGDEKKFIDALLAAYPGRIADAAGFAEENRVLLLKTAHGVGIDIVLAGLPFEEDAVKRASFFEFLPGINLITCSAEDLIIMKAFADRPQDWVDIQNIIDRQRGKIDKLYIVTRLSPLCDIKEAPEILSRLNDLLSKS